MTQAQIVGLWLAFLSGSGLLTSYDLPYGEFFRGASFGVAAVLAVFQANRLLTSYSQPDRKVGNEGKKA